MKISIALFIVLCWTFGATMLSFSYFVVKNQEKILKIAKPIFSYILLPIIIGIWFSISTGIINHI